MGIIDNALKIANIVSEVDNAALKKDILDLLEECHKLQEENIALKKDILELKEALELKESLTFRDNMYWKKSGEGPYCPSCYDSKKEIHNLTFNTTKIEYTCPTCKNKYSTPQQQEEYNRKIAESVERLCR